MSFRITVFCFLIYGFTNLSVIAQAPNSHKKGLYRDSDSIVYYPLSEPFYLSLGTSPDSTDISLNLNNPKDADGTKLNKSGKVNFDFVRYNGMRIPSGRYSIIMDGTKPTSATRFLEAPSATREGRLYYGKGLVVAVNSKDTYSGLKGLYYSLDNTTFAPYADRLTFDQEGTQNLSYYGVDFVGNVEDVKKEEFIVDLTAPSSSYEKLGVVFKDIFAKRSTIKLKSSDALSGLARVQWQLDGGKFRTYQTPILLSQLRDGKHVLTYKGIDRVNNEEVEQQYTFEVDRIAPLVKHRFIGENFIRNKVYINASTQLKIISIDNRSGINKVYYSIDGQPTQEYTSQISFSDTIGSHTISYYAIDQVGNSTRNKNTKVQVVFDNDTPEFSVSYKGPNFLTKDTLYIREFTKITTKVTDKLSGVKRVFCQIDNKKPLLSSGMIKLKKEGFHRIQFTSSDWVANTRIDTVEVFVDRQPPEITHQISTNTLGVKEINGEKYQLVPSQSKVFMSAIDQGTGVDELYYVTNGGLKKEYSGAIDNFRKNTPIILELFAVDHLANTKRKVIRLYIEE